MIRKDKNSLTEHKLIDKSKHRNKKLPVITDPQMFPVELNLPCGKLVTVVGGRVRGGNLEIVVKGRWHGDLHTIINHSTDKMF